jgi:hypothetical protein
MGTYWIIGDELAGEARAGVVAPESVNNSHVIPAKLAIASASRNPGISKTSGCPLST